MEDSQLPDEVDVLLDMERESLSDLNTLAQAVDGLSDSDINKLGAVVSLAKPQTAVQIKNLVENLDLFDFAPGAHTPEEYGKYMITTNRDEMLRMTLHTRNGQRCLLVLPADNGYLNDVKSRLGVDDFAEVEIRDVRFKVPYIGELMQTLDCPSVEEYNRFAVELENIWQRDGALLTYAAVLDAERPETLHRARELLQDLDNYQRITDAYDYGQQRLQETLGLDDEDIAELEGFMDFEKYGHLCMENDGVVTTEFGRLRRLEPPFSEQEQGMRMM